MGVPQTQDEMREPTLRSMCTQTHIHNNDPFYVLPTFLPIHCNVHQPILFLCAIAEDSLGVPLSPLKPNILFYQVLSREGNIIHLASLC